MTSDYANEVLKRIMAEKIVDIESRIFAEETAANHYRKLYNAADRARLLTENRLKATQDQLEEYKKQLEEYKKQLEEDKDQLEEYKKQLEEERKYFMQYVFELTALKNKRKENLELTALKNKRKENLELTASKNKRKENVSDSLFSPVAISAILLILFFVGLFIPSWFIGVFSVVLWEVVTFLVGSVVTFLVGSLMNRSMSQL